VVLEADTGRILALSSQPDFDPGEWVGGISERRYRELADGGALVDYPAQAQLPPGSIFKPMTVVAMDRAGLPIDGSYPCPADYTAGGRTFANYDSEAFGQISLRRAIEVSCNTVFYRAADRLWQRGGGQRADADEVDPVARAAMDFGLGEATGVDLPAESAGLVSSPAAKHRLWEQRKEAWCAAAKDGYPRLRQTDPARADYFTALDRENCRTGNLWRQGDAINAGIGQGLTTVTPLQMASAYAAIANGGTLVRPRLGRAIVAPDGSVVEDLQPQPRGQVDVPAPVLRFLRESLAGVPRTGTAESAFAGFPLDRFPVAGKTGSAQVEGQVSTSWFASFAPVRNPRYVVVVMISHGGTGGENAAPAARGIYEKIFGVGTKAAFPPAGPPQGIPSPQGVLP
jgi:penicillin-binding protein 2